MRTRASAIDLQALIFEVDEVPVEAVVTGSSVTYRQRVHSNKALVHRPSGRVLGVVGRDYHVVTNQKAIDLARKVAVAVFPDWSEEEWQVRRATGPRTLSYACIDLLHSTHAVNLKGSASHKADCYTPFIRVTNSFNGTRALRFDFGFMRMHCSNGVIVEEEIATLNSAHRAAEVRDLKIEARSPGFESLWESFAAFTSQVRWTRKIGPVVKL